MTDLIEINFDGLVGPSHHFGGLGLGNLASMNHMGAISHPRAAALQGLDKMRLVASLANPDAMRQAILPPQPRPLMDWLQTLGFQGNVAQILRSAGACSPTILSAAWSVASMWTANAATVTPAMDTRDGRTHLTVSNLTSTLHRSLEADQTYRDLCSLFRNCHDVEVHKPLNGGWAMRDEGAANHMRLAPSHDATGIHVFVHEPNLQEESPNKHSLERFPSRQSRLASQIIAFRHSLPAQRFCLIAQHTDAINAGAFHNDVVATSHNHVLIYHELAFQDAGRAIDQIAAVFREQTKSDLEAYCISASQLSLSEAIESYLFNSQIIPLCDGGLGIICPAHCQENENVAAWLTDHSGHYKRFRRVEFIDLRESMANGGGPACLRLRVPLPSHVVKKLPAECWWTPERDEALREIISKEYPEALRPMDLFDPEIASATQDCVSRVRTVLGWT